MLGAGAVRRTQPMPPIGGITGDASGIAVGALTTRIQRLHVGSFAAVSAMAAARRAGPP